jgi:hypothetical protein
VILYLVLGVMMVLAVVLFAMYSRMQDENIRIHRVYYGTAALKIAEACETEAFTWLRAQLALPADDQHPFLRRLYSELSTDLSVTSGAEPADPLSDPRYLNLLEEGLLATSVSVASSLPGGGDIQRATLCFKDLQPIFTTPSSAMDPSTQGRVISDPNERFGAVELSVAVGYGKIRRGAAGKINLVKRYICRRDLKVVNLLLPTVSRFTLFAHKYTGPAINEPYNVDIGPMPHTGWQEELAGVSALQTQQPLILIHSPKDVREKIGAVEKVKELTEYLPFAPPFDKMDSPGLSVSTQVQYRPNLQDRGWVFLGGSRPWSLNMKNGLVNPKSPLVPNFDNLWAEEITAEGFMLRETFVAANHTQLAGIPHAAGWNPDLAPGGTPINGYRFSLWAYGVPGGILTEPVFQDGIFANHYSRAVGATQSKNPSLLRLYGDVQPHDLDAAGLPARYIDRRSPTLVFGPVLRRYARLGRISQIDEEDKNATAPPKTFPKDSAGTDIFPYRNPKSSEPSEAFIPYFHIVGSALEESEARFFFGSAVWNTSAMAGNLNLLDDTLPGTPPPSDPRPPDYPRVRFKINEHVFRGTSGPPVRLLELLQSRIRTQHYNSGLDWLIENAHPGGIDPPRHLDASYVSILQAFDGSTPSGSSAFYGTQNPNTDLCYFAGNLRLHQFDEGAGPPGNLANTGSFPFHRGFFEGSLGALRLFDPSVTSDQILIDGGIPPALFDIRMKTTHAFQNESEFLDTFLPGGANTLELSPGIALIRSGDLDLEEGRGELVYQQGGMILVDGNLRLPRVVKSPEARDNGEILTFVSLNGNIELVGNLIEASIVVLGDGKTVTRSVEQVTIRGNLVVDTLDFSPGTPGNFFAGRSFPVGGATVPTGPVDSSIPTPLEAWPRNTIEYDPVLNQAAAARYRKQYRAFVSGGISYWQVGE